MIGKTVAHYKIVEKLGEGGMGVVYRASDSKLSRDVALKVLPPAFSQDDERLARFKREAQLLASLNHPHIGAIYGFEDLEGSGALVLELVAGPTLQDRIAAGALPLEEALPIALQIAGALEAAHEKGIVHRDLKPANVKLTVEGKVKVLDFGLAKALETEPMGESSVSMAQSPTITGQMTGANVILGTAAYMSPEQARGQPVDRRADIWAFGAILFEMLTGRRLFQGETISDTLASVLKTDLNWAALPENTPYRVRQLIQRCLDRDPRQRLRDIGEARITLDTVLQGGEEAEPQTKAPVISHPPGRRSLLPWLAAALAAVLVGGAVWLLRPEETPVPVRRFELPVEDARASLSSGTTLAISPDGSRVAYTSQDRLWIRDLDRLEVREVSGSGGSHNPMWAPDGQRLAFLAAGKLWKVPATGGEPAAVCALEEATSPAGGGAWLEEGGIVFSSGDGGLFRVSVQGGDPKTILLPDTTAGEEDYHNLSTLPGGRGLLYILHREEGFDTLVLLAGGEKKVLVQAENQSLTFPCYSPSGHILYQRDPDNAGIWALPFSLSSLEATGDPFLVVPEGAVPHVAMDGTLIYLRGMASRNTQLVWVNRDGVPEGTIGAVQEIYPSPRLAPDGIRVAVRATEGDNSDIWIHDAERGTKTRFTFEEDSQHYPEWSPSGDRIYYQSGGSSSTFKIKMSASDGTGSPQELFLGGWHSVSPDGRHLLYSKYTDSQWDLWWAPILANGTVGEQVPFLENPAVEYWPQLSPNGGYLAYISNESGVAEIYVKRFPSGEGKWQASVKGGHWPRWSHDGTELFFIEGERLMAIPVEYQPSFRLGTPKLLFAVPASGISRPFGWPDAFDVSADGQRFVLVQNADEARGSEITAGIVVVQNWSAEFEE